MSTRVFRHDLELVLGAHPGTPLFGLFGTFIRESTPHLPARQQSVTESRGKDDYSLGLSGCQSSILLPSGS